MVCQGQGQTLFKVIQGQFFLDFWGPTVFGHVFGVPDQWIQWFLVDICRYIELVSSVCKPTNTTGKPPSCMVGLVLMLKAFGWMMSSGTSDVRARACPPRMG